MGKYSGQIQEQHDMAQAGRGQHKTCQLGGGMHGTLRLPNDDDEWTNTFSFAFDFALGQYPSKR